MNFIEGVALSNLCDFSFGDVEGLIHNIVDTHYVDVGDNSFLDFLKNHHKEYATIFIGNSRLTQLLSYITNYDKKFIIFCNLEDTPILENIQPLIPENVLSINAPNAIGFGGKIFAIPYGIQRRLDSKDWRDKVLEQFYNSNSNPINLLYVNHSVETNHSARSGINEIFKNYSWSLVRTNRIDYASYIMEIRNHKFMICPVGHAIDCHRNWEVLYMRRVPVMLYDNYLVNLFKDYPILFVNSWDEVTEKLLIENNNLYDKIQNMSLSNLDIVNMFNNCIRRHYD